ncbi:hexokinase [Corynespora cassiicola Philippines]|uniref:Phosphotransferase n=1 Tax=Corynespora cassiicola Philippines TaxID=1448308 RepID=A0A2T2NJG4_CORCC|nr:hexokinase [Corynespora cassiicola Philippines]
MQLVHEDASWRQRSELKKMVDMSEGLEKEMQRLDEDFWVSGSKLKEIVSRFREELDEGLREEKQNIAMYLTWVPSLPRGDETGTLLTLDLGGTNLRVCKVDLYGNSPPEGAKDKYSITQETFKLPAHIKSSTASDLWAHIADSLQTFLSKHNLDTQYRQNGKKMPFGFTFSYPAIQDRIDHAVLQTWTKGFDIKGVEGHDVAAQLREKLQERDLPVELVCIVNDTVGALVASAYKDPNTIIGAVFGTGCNAAYLASLSSITKLKNEKLEAALGDGDAKGRKMAINCEYGAFDNAHCVLPRTKYDVQIDEESPRPGEQTFEKLSAGLYLGEIFRLVLLELSSKGLAFRDQDLHKLEKSYTIDTGFLSQIEDDESEGLRATRSLFGDVLGIEVQDRELELARRVAELVAVRGARLCACGHVADGEEGVGNEGPIRLTSAEDGSGVGCAIIAAMELERRNR